MSRAACILASERLGILEQGIRAKAKQIAATTCEDPASIIAIIDALNDRLGSVQ